MLSYDFLHVNFFAIQTTVERVLEQHVAIHFNVFNIEPVSKPKWVLVDRDDEHCSWTFLQFSSSPSTSSFDNNDSSDTTVASGIRSSSLLIDLFQSQTDQIVNAVLKLTRQNDLNDNDRLLRSSFEHLSLTSFNDREEMQLVKNIAIAVRDLLQTLEYAPSLIKEMVCSQLFIMISSWYFFVDLIQSEQRYGHFSTLVVTLIDNVRQRNYMKMYEQAIEIGRTAKSLFHDIKQLS